MSRLMTKIKGRPSQDLRSE